MDIFTQFQELISTVMGERMIILIPINIILLSMLKSVPKIPKWSIQWILIIVSFVLALMFNSSKEDLLVEAILTSTFQSILAVGVAISLRKKYMQKKTNID